MPIQHRVKYRDLLIQLAHEGVTSDDLLMLIMDIEHAAPDALADIAVGVTDEFDGTGTAVVVDILSSAAGDTEKTGTLYGLDADGAYATEAFTLDDTDATTAVTTTGTWTRLFGVILDATCAGAVTVHETGGTTETYQTVAIGDLYSYNTKWFIPTGLNALFLYLDARFATPAAATPAAGFGVSLGANLSGRVLLESMIANSGQHALLDVLQAPQVGNGDTYLAVQTAKIDTDDAPEPWHHAVMLAWS
ncbi:MAG: hypothetical protein SXV54_24275 [Chloroflexota bacterium]|nr:hypothetical protein [Chloroflexota bacterium]